MTPYRTILAFVVALLAVLMSVTPVSAATVYNNSAVSIATNPYRPQVHMAWQVEQASGDVTASNQALAESEDCTGCVATALAFQILVVSDVGNLVLTNNATSINTECETCTATTVADQWAIASNVPIHLNLIGQLRLAAIHFQLAALLFAPPATVNAEAPILEAEVNNVLADDVVTTPTGMHHWLTWRHDIKRWSP